MPSSIAGIISNRLHDPALASLLEKVSIAKRNSTQALVERINNVQKLPRLKAEFVALLEKREDPALASNRESYQTVTGELYGAGGPSLADLDQGRIGDCFFLAAVGSMVAEDPGSIREMITENDDGTYDVRFYAEFDGERQAVTVTVDNDLPVDAHGNLVYAGANDADEDGQLELWVPILEKAYAKFQDKYGPDDGVDGYADLDGGGWPDNVMEDLTGRPAFRTSDYSTDEELLALLEQLEDDKYVSVATLSSGTDSGWVSNHAYTVVGTYEQDGETMVILKNPWGTREPEGSDPMGADDNDGLFAIALSEVRENTRSVQIGQPKSDSLPEGLAHLIRLTRGSDLLIPLQA